MRVASCLLLLCLALAGCKSFAKKDSGTASKEAAPSGSLAGAGPATPVQRSDAAPAGVNGLLVGQVLDPSYRRLPGAYIQVSEAGEVGQRGAPIEVAADQQGYFAIRGVQEGHRYQLTARARDGSRQMTGTVWATPPASKVVILMSGDYSAPTPAIAAPPVGSDQGWSPDRNAGSPRAAELRPPTGAVSPLANPPPPEPTPSGDPLQPRTAIIPENTAREDKQASKDDPDTAAIRSQAQNNAPPPAPTQGQWGAPLSTAAPAEAPNFGPTRVPSCVLTGQTLFNFALYDIGGRPWEFRRHTSRLILLDFWETHCIPCQYAIPHLNALQQRYGAYGLQVVGIAYETGTFQEQVRKVNNVRDRLRINYSLLLGGSPRCPVQTQFGVNAYPTLVLLDGNGRILWRATGANAQVMRDLEIRIQQQLSAR